MPTARSLDAPGQRAAAPDGIFVQCDGMRFHLVDQGQASASPILLIHGYLAAGHVWRATAPFLVQRGRRALMIDLPGCGFSDRPPDPPYDLEWLRDRMERFIDELGSGPLPIIAHSLGGAVALHLAAECPHHVTALVLVSPLCFKTPLPRILAPAARLPGFFKAFFRTVGRPLIEPAMRKNFAGAVPEDASELARISIEHLDAPGGWNSATRMGVAAAFRKPMEPLLERIDVPVLVAFGERDTVHPPVLGERLVATLPRAEALRFPDCGHNPHLEHPREFGESVGRWLESVRA